MTLSRQQARRHGRPRRMDVLPEAYYSSLLEACIDLIKMRDIVRDLHYARLDIPESLRYHLSRLTIFVDERLNRRPRYQLDPKTVKRHMWKWLKHYGDDTQPRWVMLSDGRWVRLPSDAWIE